MKSGSDMTEKILHTLHRQIHVISTVNEPVEHQICASRLRSKAPTLLEIRIAGLNQVHGAAVSFEVANMRSCTSKT